MVCCRCLLGSRRGCSPGQAQPASSYLAASDYASIIVQHPQESRTQTGTAVGTKKKVEERSNKKRQDKPKMSRRELHTKEDKRE